MGTYLTLQLLPGVSPEEMNERYFMRFPMEKEEVRYLSNWDRKKMSCTVHFYTREELVADARWFRDTAKRRDLGIKATMTDEEVIGELQAQFRSWFTIGRQELKLSAQTLCGHRLKRVAVFIEKELRVQGCCTVSGFQDLKRYLGYGFGWDSEYYCSACKAQAAVEGVALPIRHATPRSNTIVDANNRVVTQQYNGLHGVGSGHTDNIP